MQAAFQRWDRALVAVFTLADPAGDADRFKLAFEIKPVGIDQFCGVGDFTAEADGVAAHRGCAGSSRFGNIMGKTEIA